MLDGVEGADRDVVLAGGVANVGAVVRRGDCVLRPSNPHTATVHRFLRCVRDAGFDGVPEPVGVDPDGRERLRFVEGDVPLLPYPDWAQTDEALASVARLIRHFHEAAAAFEPVDDDSWSSEMACPGGGPVVCHNDVCLENVVFRDGRAVALLDFDFAAPGTTAFDVACFARMCVPIDDDSRARFGWTPADLQARLRLVADEYGLDAGGRREVLRWLDAAVAHGGRFLLRQVEAGHPGFVEMWESAGGMARFDRRRDWWAEVRGAFESVMA